MKRGVVLGLAAGAVVVVLGWYFLLFAPLSSDVDSTHSKVAEAKRQTLELKATVSRLEGLSANAPQQQATLRRLNAAIPATPDLADFILQANRIAAESGIDWLSVSPAPPAATAGGTNSTIALSMQIEGGFFQVLDYLNRLEDLERLVVVDGVNISASTAGSTTASGATASVTATGAPTLAVTLTGRMFTRTVVATATPTTPGAPAAPTSPTPTTPSTAPSSGGST